MAVNNQKIPDLCRTLAFSTSVSPWIQNFKHLWWQCCGCWPDDWLFCSRCS